MNSLVCSLFLSKSASSTALEISEIILFVFGAILVIGLVGETLKAERWEKHHWLFEILVIVGVGGELIADGGIYRYSRELQTINDSEIAVLNEKAANAERDAANAQKEDAGLRLQIEQERSARDQLAQTMQWRHLSNYQKKALCQVFFPGGISAPAVLVSAEEDAEAWSYANDFSLALTECEMSLHRGPGGHLKAFKFPPNVPLGLWVNYSDSSNPEISTIPVPDRRAAAESLAKSLRAIGIKVEGISTNGLTPYSIGFPEMPAYIYVGPRLPPIKAE